jgi:hypothetical protein
MGLTKVGLLPAEGLGLRDPTRPIVTGGLGWGIVVIPAGDLTDLFDAGVGVLDRGDTLVGALATSDRSDSLTLGDGVLDLLDLEFAHPFLWVESDRLYGLRTGSESLPQLTVEVSGFRLTTGLSGPVLAVGDAGPDTAVGDASGTMSAASDGSPIGQ